MRPFPTLIVLVLALAAGYLLGRSEISMPGSAQPAENVLPEAAQTGADARVLSRSAAQQAHRLEPQMDGPLPEPDLPFSQQIDALLAAAQDGHPKAACRLHLGAHRCRMAAARLWMAEDMQRRLEAGKGARLSEDLMLDSIASTYERAEASIAYCKDMQPEQLPDTSALIEKALPGMDNWQKVLLVMMRQDGGLMRLPQHFGAPDGLGTHTEYLYPQFLSDQAHDILRQGIVEANPLALEGLIMLHAPAWIPGGPTSPRLALPDRRAFAHYALLMQELQGGQALGPVIEPLLVRVMAGFSDQELRQLKQETDIEAERWRVRSAQQADQARNQPGTLDDMPERLCEQ